MYVRKKRRMVAEINVVPYIDVMLVLLVIFMITAPMLTQGIHVNLPQAQAKAMQPQKVEPIVVSVNAQGQYFLNTNNLPQQAIDASDLTEQVNSLLAAAKQKNQERDVYVKGDRDANYGEVVKAMVLLQQAGAKEVGLITDPQQQAT